MVETLEGLQSVAVYTKSIIVQGRNMTEHEERLQEVMDRLEAAGLKLNTEIQTRCFVGAIVVRKSILKSKVFVQFCA